MKPFAIFPASGALAESTITHLLRFIPGSSLTLISRYPGKTPQSYTDAGVHTRQADYIQTPSELEAAFSGIEVLFLVSYPSHQHKLRTELHRKAVDAAHRAGVKHIFYSSLAFAGEGDQSVAEVMGAHLDTERYLRELAGRDGGFGYTVVREGLYSESTPIYTAFWEPGREEDGKEISIPHGGGGRGVSWVKRDELGEGTARLIEKFLAENGGKEGFKKEWVNGRVLLTGRREWTLEDTVKVLGEVTGKEVQIKEVEVEEYVKLPRVLEYFGKEEMARTWSTAWEAIRNGETAMVTRELEELLGRKPEEFDVTIKEAWEKK